MTIPNNEKTLANPLSRETSPRTNQMIAELSPSRETGPHPHKSTKKLAQALKKRIRHETEPRTHTPKPDYPSEMFTKVLKPPIQIVRPSSSMKRLANALKRRIGQREWCVECGEEHPTPLCTKHLERSQGSRVTSPFVFDNSLTNNKALRDPKKPINNESDLLTDLEKAMAKLSIQPPKTVTFDLPGDTPDTPSDDDDKAADGQTEEIENPTSQSDEVDTRLAHTAWLRKTSDNIYMSNRKSMNLRAYIHAAHRRTEAPALLDSGATENFMSLTYAKWLKLPFKHLPYERPLLNVDGTMNKTGSLKYYVDLQVQTGSRRTSMRFFLTDLGHHRAILGYPWFAANQPKIDWAREWIDTVQLPLILRNAKAEKPQFNPSTRNLPNLVDLEILYIGRIIVTPQITRQTTSSSLLERYDRPNLTPILAEYRCHHKV